MIAQYPGASAEEVERQVTIPLEIALAGMPGLDYTRSKSLFGLAHLRNQFDYGADYFRARLEVLNRLNSVELPAGREAGDRADFAHRRDLSLRAAAARKDAQGKDIYSLYDLKALNDWKLEKEFRRVPRIADVVSFGGAVKRYEIQPDPERLKQYGITLEQLEDAIANSNANVGGDYLRQGDTVQAVRGLGLIGGGQDPMAPLDAEHGAASRLATACAAKRTGGFDEIRQVVLAATNNVPIKISDVVDGGRHGSMHAPGRRRRHAYPQRPRGGQPAEDRAAKASNSSMRTGTARVGRRRRRRGRHRAACARGRNRCRPWPTSRPKCRSSTTPGELLPGVTLDTIYDRSELIQRDDAHGARECAGGHRAGGPDPADLPERRAQRASSWR